MSIIRTVVQDILHLVETYNFDFVAQPMMPELERQFLESAYRSSNGILEFGSGGSTLFALQNAKKILSVESDKKYFNYLFSHIVKKYSQSQIAVKYADIGVTGKYGMPLFYPISLGVAKKGLKYILTGYESVNRDQIDLIFVDGRWRVACCLFSLIKGYDFDRITLILDDYWNHGYSDYIEKYFEVSMHGRIAKLYPKEYDNSTLIDDFISSIKLPF